MTNLEIATVFREIANLLEKKKENWFKIRAYRKVAEEIEKLTVDLSQLASEGKLREIPGVGEAIAKKITEMLSTGKLQFYEKLKAEVGVEMQVSKPKSNETSQQLTSLDDEAIRLFREAIASGKHWYLGLLEAVGRWSSSEEIYQGRHYQYLIDGSAFDWQLLAERLCEAVDGLLPEKEKSDFLLKGKPPLDITKEQFQELIGTAKYRQYLNYFYGVTVEEAIAIIGER